MTIVGADPSAAGTAQAPLTNVDVVRMVASQRPTSEILETIRTAPTTAFDLDPDVVIELRRAHVPDAIIAAMKEAQRVSAPPAPAGQKATGVLEVVFEKAPDGDVARSTAVMMARDWKDRPVSLGFFLICLNPLHVPDLWDTKSPLGGTFPRHHLFWLADTTRPWKESRRGGLVFLELPERVGLDAEAGVHDLSLGIAVRIADGPWQPAVNADTRVEIRTGETARMIVRVKSLKTSTRYQAAGAAPLISCEIVSIEPPQTPRGAPGASPPDPPDAP